MSEYVTPRSPRDEIDGMVYFPRLFEKIRLHAAGKLHSDYHANLGRGMDLWTCQLLGVRYEDIVDFILSTDPTDEVAYEEFIGRNSSLTDELRDWWNSYMRNRGFRDDFSELLEQRKKDAGFQERDNILTFFDFIDADEGRL